MAASRVLRTGGLYFNARNYVRIEDNPSLRHLNGITVLAWIYPINISYYTDPITCYVVVAGNSYLFRIDGFGEGSKLSWFVYIDNAIEPRLSSTYVLSLNTWYHVAGVYNSSNGFMGLYINGALNNSRTRTGTPTLGYFSVVNVGARPEGTCFFYGLIDEVRIYNRALTADEIYEIYSKGTFIKDGLVLYLPFYEGEGNIVHDVSGYGNHGTIYGGAMWVVKKALVR